MPSDRVRVTCPGCGLERSVAADTFRKYVAGRVPRCLSCTGRSGGKASRSPAPAQPRRKTPRPLCRHCGKKLANRPGMLCWACYYTPGVKELYPSTSKYARRGCGNFSGAAGEPLPTDATPGSPEKLAVLEARAAAGQRLFSAKDATHERGARK